jgi:hypothetical protein
MEEKETLPIRREQLTQWADTCLRMNHLGTLIQRELNAGNSERARELAERARTRAWTLLNELFASGAEKPSGYAEPSTHA